MPSTDEDLKKALKAFKKRMKLTQLDDDSKLGRSPLTGSKAKVVSIQPPAGFGREIWEELVEKGRRVRLACQCLVDTKRVLEGEAWVMVPSYRQL